MVDTASKVEEDMVAAAAMVVVEAIMEVVVDTSRAVVEVDTSKVMPMFTPVHVFAMLLECNCCCLGWLAIPPSDTDIACQI